VSINWLLTRLLTRLLLAMTSAHANPDVHARIENRTQHYNTTIVVDMLSEL